MQYAWSMNDTEGKNMIVNIDLPTPRLIGTHTTMQNLVIKRSIPLNNI